MENRSRFAINRKASFVLGKKVKTVFDIVDTFIHPEEGRAALNIAMSDQEMIDGKREYKQNNAQRKLSTEAKRRIYSS